MIKEYTPSDFVGLDPLPVMVKTSSSRMGSHDFKQLVDRVGQTPAQFIKNSVAQWLPGEVPLYVSAMGCTEITGPNRNFDGFKAATLSKRHHTYITKLADRSGAFWYRDHKNRDTHKSYGIVKDATFEPRTGRVLLICGLNGTKEAADRTQGLIADKELNDIESNKDIPVSMSVRLPFDKCASCGHEAKSRAEYCTEKTCKHGGCAANMGKAYEDGFVQHVDNPGDLEFFDISRISDLQADRIAFALGLLDEHKQHKVAAHRPVEEQLAIVLAGYEAVTDISRFGWFGSAVKEAVAKSVSTAPDDSYLTALSSTGVVLPYAGWCKLAGIKPDGTPKNLFSRIVAQKKFPKIATWSRSATPQAELWAQRCDASISITGRGIFKAAAMSVTSQNKLETKSNFDGDLTASELAYAGYQMRLVQDLPSVSSCQLMIATNFLN